MASHLQHERAIPVAAGERASQHGDHPVLPVDGCEGAMGRRYLIGPRALLAVIAAAALGCAAAVRPAPLTQAPPIESWWQPPADLASRDLFNGPWGAEHAPDPNAEYTFVRPKT